MDFAASLSADLSAALAVDVVEDRPHTGERHVCVRPVSAERAESVNIDEVQGHSRSLLTCCAYSKLQITGTDSNAQFWQGILSPRTYGRHRTSIF